MAADTPQDPQGGAPLVERDALSRFPCESCGGELSFDVASQRLKCAHCGHTQAVPSVNATIEELDLEGAQARGKGRGYGVRRKALRCESCGAITSFDDTSTSVKCAFCDSKHVIEVADDPNILQPSALIPFQLDRAAALELFGKWLKGRWFKPNDLVKTWALKEIRGVYVPFWTFDVKTASDWTAMAGYYYYVTVSYTATENGRSVQKTRQERRTRWEPASGHFRAEFDDELVCASHGLPRALVRELEPYETGALTPYQPPFLAGWEAERYQIDLKEGWNIGREQIDSQIRAGCSAQVPGDTQKDLRVQTKYWGWTFKHVLLPIWVAAYHYREKLYRFLVNGQTGKVSGTAPISWIKVTALVLAITAVLVGLYYAGAFDNLR